MADRLTAQSGAVTSGPDGHAAQAGSVNRGVGRLTAQTGIARWGQGRLTGAGIAHRGDMGGEGVEGGQLATQRGAANSGTEAQPEPGLRVWGGGADLRAKQALAGGGVTHLQHSQREWHCCRMGAASI